MLTNRQIYIGTTIGRYEQMLFHGIRAAAQAQDCNLLLACGLGPDAVPYQDLPAWPSVLPHTNFVPVGPWNTSGLIAIPPFSAVQLQSLQALLSGGHPCVFTYPQEGYPSVSPANHEGIEQAFAHLVAHGHRRIAFIADTEGARGDGAERLAAYRAALAAQGLPFNPAFVGYGGHDAYRSYDAMGRMLEAALDFTAVLASNDESAIGALRALGAAGRRVPQDVAVIGFDDVFYAKAQAPPLTTVRHPTFEMGFQAVELLLEYVTERRTAVATVRVPTRLIVRESCGCPPASTAGGPVPPEGAASDRLAALDQDRLIQVMADAVSIEMGQRNVVFVDEWCRRLVAALFTPLADADPRLFAATLDQLLDSVEATDDDAYPWYAALAVLRHQAGGPPTAIVEALIDQAHQRISERIRRQHIRFQVRQAELTARMGTMTTRLLTALELRDILAILEEHLPGIGIQRAYIALFEEEDADPVAWSTLYQPVPDGSPVRLRFPSRQFPPARLYETAAPFALVLLPLIVEDGPSGYVTFDATYLEPCGLIVRHLAAAFRNSQLHRAAEEGRRLAEEANRLKSRFLSTVSHELRTPLGIILGLSEMVLSESAGEGATVSDTMRQDVQRIHENAQHLGRMIGDVLDLAGSEVGQLRLYQESLDLVEVLEVVLRTGAQLAKEKGLAWQAHLPAARPWVHGDRTRLRQVALNLISNAVKFTDHGAITVDLSIAGNTITVAITDTGPGVPLTDQQQIFEEFRSSERTAARGYGGLGLGLTICKQLIERHGGTIGLHSSGEEDGGATFFFTLPLIDAQVFPLDRQGAVPADHLRVVLATAHATGQNRMATALLARGFDVQIEPIGVEADWLSRLVATPPAAVILDEALATGRGWEILGVLKRHPATAHLPVLMYALNPDDDHGALLELDYLMKPLAPEQLTYVLEQQRDPDDPSAAARTILVVDDDPGIRALHTRLIRQQLPQGRVLQASNGREALALMERERPNLVLLDLMMPELDGFGVLAAMRERPATRDVPVIVLTAQTLTEDDMVRLNTGVAAILSKSLFSSDEILQHIEATLGHQRKLGSSMQLVVRRAVAFIHAHSQEAMTREQLAEHLTISADHLTASFRQEMGITPIAYLNRYRISRACVLLAETSRSITDIALSVGFTDHPSFSRMFHREIGMTPHTFRREKQQKA